MTKHIFLGLSIAISFLFSGCCSTAPLACGSAKDKFRLNLHRKEFGKDVRNWQCFLLAKGFSALPPTGHFSRETEAATKRFQESPCYGGADSIDITGTVTYATFAKAVTAGMTEYPFQPRPPTQSIPYHGSRHRKAVRGQVEILNTIGTGEIFDMPMSKECIDPNSTGQVHDWQSIVSFLGYKTIGDTPGDFNSNTTNATSRFQSAKLTGVPGVIPGVVDSAHTYPTAVSICNAAGCTINLTPKANTPCH